MTADADGSDARSTLSHRTQHAILLNKVPGESAVELALVFFPAGGVDGEVYTPLMHIIQTTAQMFCIRLYVAIVKPPSTPPSEPPLQEPDPNTPTPHPQPQPQIQQQIQLQNALKDLREIYRFKAAPHQVVLAGHADGAHTAQEIAAASQHAQHSMQHEQLPFSPSLRPFAGVVSYCCLPQRCFVDANYPVPLLTVLGDRDGLVRLSHAAESCKKLEEAFPDPEMRAQRVPVSIYPKFTHRWFSLGAGSPHINALDLNPPTPTTIAPRELGYMTSMFLHVLCPDSVAPSVTGPPRHFNLIRNAVAADFLYLAPYRHASANDRSGETCAKAQQCLLGLRSDPPRKGATLLPHMLPHMHGAVSANSCAEGSRTGDFAKVATGGENVIIPGDSVRVWQPRTFHGAPVATSVACMTSELIAKRWSGCGGNGAVGCQSTCSCDSEEERFRSVAAGVFSEGRRVVAWPQVCIRTAHYTEDPLATPSQPAALTLHCKFAARRSVAAAVCSLGRHDTQHSTQHAEGVASAEPDNMQGRHALEGISESDAVDADAGACAASCAQRAAERDEFAAARLNEEVLLSVLEKLPEHVRASYACAPQRLVFGADIMASCMSDWLKSELVFEKRPSEEHSKAHNASIAAEKTAVLLRAVCFETPVDTSAECSDPGTFCCTLLSETQAYEYILYESQREGSIQKSAC